ncbi:hypothetical protein NUK34_17305 [Kerstersia gyiorum]|uniref:hypothetical protein n=1 Tax=Kerstersia gyiorum TaxID=206506 RepID=UPI0021503014|nr:hypothetical protein [Kerstersia gyiorum]MCR4160610.1 hypothetical protein [Kerstersia gyiorum]
MAVAALGHGAYAAYAASAEIEFDRIAAIVMLVAVTTGGQDSADAAPADGG